MQKEEKNNEFRGLKLYEMSILTHLIAVYTSTDKGYNQKSYLELHDVRNFNKLGPGRPVTKKFIEDLAATVGEKNTVPKSQGILPQNLLFINFSAGKRMLVWWTPEQKRKMAFTKDLLEKYELKNTEAWQPPLLWFMEGEKISVFIMRNGIRPDEKTELFYANYPNIHNDGDICTGTVRTEHVRHLDTIEQLMAFWDNFFFNAKFSHDGESMPFWAIQIKEKFKYKIPVDEKPWGTLTNILNKCK